MGTLSLLQEAVVEDSEACSREPREAEADSPALVIHCLLREAQEPRVVVFRLSEILFLRVEVALEAPSPVVVEDSLHLETHSHLEEHRVEAVAG